MSKKDNGFIARTLMALTTALADRAALDEQIKALVASLAKEHGVSVAPASNADQIR